MNTKNLSFKKNFLWTFFGNTFYAGTQWGIVVLMANIGSAEMVGQYSLGLAITAPIILFFNFQLRSVIATDTNNQYEYSTYFGSRIIYQLFALLTILFFLVIKSYNTTVSIVIILIGISKIIESFSELTHGYLQKRERMDYAGKSQIIKGAVTFFAVGILLFIFEDLIIALIGLLVAWIIRLLTYDLRIVSKFTKIKPKFNENVKIILIATLPLGVVSILNSINTNIPRYFLEYYIGLEELGYFSAIAYILVAGNLLIKPLSLVAAPKLANNYNSGNVRAFLKTNVLLMSFAFFLGAILILISSSFGEIILTIVYNSEYAFYNDIFVILMIGSAVSFFTHFINLSIVAAREFKLQPVINFITTIMAIISSLFLIPVYGITGAAYVSLTVFFTQFLGSLSLFIFVIIKMKK